jgi:hypothetical protein
VNRIPENHQEVHEYIDANFIVDSDGNRRGGPITFATRCFRIGIIKNWYEADSVYEKEEVRG